MIDDDVLWREQIHQVRRLPAERIAGDEDRDLVVPAHVQVSFEQFRRLEERAHVRIEVGGLDPQRPLPLRADLCFTRPFGLNNECRTPNVEGSDRTFNIRYSVFDIPKHLL